MQAEIDLIAYRHATWGGPTASDHVAFLAEDLAGANFAWAFALSSGGAVQFTLQGAAAGRQGLSAYYDEDYLDPVRGSPIGATILVPQIDEATLENLPPPPEASADIVLVHTLYCTPSEGPKQAVFSGRFTVKQGAPN
jgi:hypothetical protein